MRRLLAGVPTLARQAKARIGNESDIGARPLRPATLAQAGITRSQDDLCQPQPNSACARDNFACAQAEMRCARIDLARGRLEPGRMQARSACTRRSLSRARADFVCAQAETCCVRIDSARSRPGLVRAHIKLACGHIALTCLRPASGGRKPVVARTLRIRTRFQGSDEAITKQQTRCCSPLATDALGARHRPRQRLRPKFELAHVRR